ncbi:TonB-dependent receptor [Pseudoflavitalea sp. G-6-1-2]|nr:TonB-dependent receptor [Pseudoflavitalea sp. G-6-1-2]
MKCNSTALLSTGFRWRMILLSLFLVYFSPPLFAQNLIPVKGQITDEKGNFLGGVSVTIQGTSNGTTTDSSGKFSISVPSAKTVLVYSRVGYEPFSQAVGASSDLRISLKQKLNDLNEVIVVGYGQKVAKRDVTGAISSIGAKEIENRQPVNIFDAIQGMAPGVRVMNESGSPGEESDIAIRGLSTLSDAGIKPLYIVDGAPMKNISVINPKDIQSIEILKDAASAAIYGSRSANGVIIITTKRGTEGKPQVNIDILRSYSRLSNRISQANRLQRQMFDRRGNLGLDPKNDDSTSFNRNSDNDYQDLITQTAARTQVDLGLRGGTQVLNYFNSVQYLDETGIIINSFNKRMSLRSNVEYRPNKRFSMLSRINFTFQNRSLIDEGNVIRQSLQRPPGMALYLPNGELLYFNGGRRNPIAEAYLRSNVQKNYKGIFYQGFEYKLLDNLVLHVDASADLEFRKTSFFSSKLLNSGNPPVNTGYESMSIPWRLQGNAYASYDRTIATKHRITALIGMNAEKNRTDETNLSGSFFVTELVQTLNAAGRYNLSDLYGRAKSSSLLGFFGKLGYDYQGRYLINGTIRRDGSSVFSRTNRWGYFPSVSAGWRFSDEKFMRKFDGFLTDGKLRVTWGITGNQEIGEYDRYQQFVFGPYVYMGTSGVRTNQKMGNENIKWESTAQTNFGIDLTFLNGRITFAGDYYIKKTTDLLYELPLSLESGFPDRVRVNAGGLENKGIELMVSGFPIRTAKFSWQVTANYSQVRNKITKLPLDYIDDIWTVNQGKEAGNFYGYKFQGIYEYDESNAYTSDYSTRLNLQLRKDAQGNVLLGKDNRPIVEGYTLPDGSKYTGDVKQLKASGVTLKGGDVIWENLPDAKGVYNENIGNEDRQFLGHGQPRWSLSLINNFNYKGFQLSFNLYGNFGGMIYNENRRNLASFSNSNTTPDAYFIENMWKYPGQITDSYRGGNKDADNMRRGGSQWLENGNFVRLQAVRLAYQLPQRISAKAAMKLVNVYIYGTNLLTWTDYTGFDPEVSQRSVTTPGNDAGRYPRRREVGMGLNVSF